MIQDVEENNRRMAYGTGCLMPSLCLVLAIIVVGCCACKQLPVTIGTDSTTAHTEWRIDTIKEMDSVFVSVKEKGDTVRVETYKYKYVYRYRDVAVHDTVTIVEDRAVEVPVEVEVEKPLSWWQRVSISIGHFSMAVGLVIIGYWSMKKYVLPRR